MPSKASKELSHNTKSAKTLSLAENSNLGYSTPEKKTIPQNYSPGRKPAISDPFDLSIALSLLKL